LLPKHRSPGAGALPGPGNAIMILSAVGIHPRHSCDFNDAQGEDPPLGNRDQEDDSVADFRSTRC